jgi:hypothetical protein
MLDSIEAQSYTSHMKHQRIFILLLLICVASAAGCGPGHVGGNEIAFLRDGQLWTIDPDGANAFAVFTDNNTPVVGYSWSPTHQILTFRTLDATFAKTSAAKHLLSNPVTALTGDLPSTLNTIGIDGGSPIPIIFSSPDLRYSNAWWNTAGSRLIYREEITATTPSPSTVFWWASQNDQPGGIARKLLPNTYSIPSIAPDSSLVLGISKQGIFTSTLNGTNIHYIFHGLLPGHPFFATLERALWQPAHQHPGILYAIESPASTRHGSSSNSSIAVELLLNDLHGHTTILAKCACTQFAWGPDGNHILYSNGPTFTIYNLIDGSSFAIDAEVGSIPYWSPDNQSLLLDGLHTLVLIKIKNQQQQLLLHDANTASIPASQAAPIVDVNALLQPVANSLWAADSRHFLFSTRERLFWQGKPLISGRGLYTVALDSHEQLQGTPVLVDSGRDIQAGWSYEDPNTSFLF